MSSNRPPTNGEKTRQQKEEFLQKIARKSQRKLKARRSRSEAWIGMRMFGLVGWAVSVPAVMGIALGVWIDRRVDSQYSWTLMLLLIGVGLGCFNGWYWIQKESRRD